MEIGGAYVRIRPYVADEDARALAALEQLARDIAGAFDRFRGTLADTGEATPPRDERMTLHVA